LLELQILVRVAQLKFIRSLLTLSLSAVAFCGAGATPSIEITNVPPFGSFANLGGRVTGASSAAYRVAVFIYVPSAGWWSKPYCDPQLTVIQPDGSWTTDMTTGGADEFATRITALLVGTNYAEPCVMGPPSLPNNVTAQAVATATVERFNPSIRWVSFSGYDWWVKTGPGLVGPGPNYFSDSTNNVWIDDQARLHLRITNRSNQWQCAEIVTKRTFGYGSYRFELASVVDNLNPSDVLGLFTWSDDPAYTHREIDIECGRWANPGDVNNAQYVVQPWDSPGHLVRYAAPAALTNSTHSFAWQTNLISYEAVRGSYSPNPATTNIISTWVFNNVADVPQTGDENVRINFWLINGNPPTDNQEQEFIVKNFQFVPPGPPLPPVLLRPRSGEGYFSFEISGQTDRRYEVQSSTNCSTWQVLDTMLATNNLMSYTATNGASLGPQFYRLLSLP
jgi:hypothetical protein